MIRFQSQIYFKLAPIGVLAVVRVVPGCTDGVLAVGLCARLYRRRPRRRSHRGGVRFIFLAVAVAAWCSLAARTSARPYYCWSPSCQGSSTLLE